MSNDKTSLKVGGMTCTGCAATVKNALEREGAKNVFVDFSMGEAVFQKPDNIPIERFIKAIEKSGYIVNDDSDSIIHSHHQKVKGLFIINVILTVPLLLSMIVDVPFLHQSWVQFILATPVLIIGLYHFGEKAIQSILHKSPSMDVLILLGSIASYVYSIIGWWLYHSHDFMFFLKPLLLSLLL